MPDGKVMILDEGELENALHNGSISRVEFDMAYRTLKELTDKDMLDVSYMTTLCAKLLKFFSAA